MESFLLTDYNVTYHNTLTQKFTYQQTYRTNRVKILNIKAHESVFDKLKTVSGKLSNLRRSNGFLKFNKVKIKIYNLSVILIKC